MQDTGQDPRLPNAEDDDSPPTTRGRNSSKSQRMGSGLNFKYLRLGSIKCQIFVGVSVRGTDVETVSLIRRFDFNLMIDSII